MALSAAALVLIGTGAVVNNGVYAQESTPEAESTPAVGSAGETETSAYDEFVAGLAANLGISDSTTADTAIKETLKQKVDEQLAASEISANEATARKERIDASEFGGFFLAKVVIATAVRAVVGRSSRWERRRQAGRLWLRRYRVADPNPTRLVLA